MNDAPAPLTPPDCDLRDFPRMMIDIPRLFASSFNATASRSPLAWMIGHKLWYRSWHQVPAASLPDDDDALCHLAEMGFDLKTFRKIRDVAMRGWVKCSDGRLYHHAVAGIALEAWIEKLHQKISSGAGNAKRWKCEFDAAPIEIEIQTTIALLMRVNPDSRSIAKAQRRASQRNPDGIPPGQKNDPGGTKETSHRDSRSHPDAIAKDKDKDKDTDNPVTDTISSIALVDPKKPPGGNSDVQVAFDEWCACRSAIKPRAGQLRLTEPRRKKLGDRIREVGLSGWRQAIASVEGSSFLRGEKSWGGAEIDWLLEPKNLTKVLEGNYDEAGGHGASGGAGGVRSSPIDAFAIARDVGGFR